VTPLPLADVRSRWSVSSPSTPTGEAGLFFERGCGPTTTGRSSRPHQLRHLPLWALGGLSHFIASFVGSEAQNAAPRPTAAPGPRAAITQNVAAEVANTRGAGLTAGAEACTEVWAPGGSAAVEGAFEQEYQRLFEQRSPSAKSAIPVARIASPAPPRGLRSPAAARSSPVGAASSTSPPLQPESVLLGASVLLLPQSSVNRAVPAPLWQPTTAIATSRAPIW
jgi:hypothetical protein